VKGKSRRRSAKQARREQRILEKIHLHAAGIDIGSESHWVAVPDDRDDHPVREFKSFTGARALRRLPAQDPQLRRADRSAHPIARGDLCVSGNDPVSVAKGSARRQRA